MVFPLLMGARDQEPWFALSFNFLSASEFPAPQLVRSDLPHADSFEDRGVQEPARFSKGLPARST